MLFQRVEADEKKGKANTQWPDYILEIALTYSNQIGFTPRETRKSSSASTVKQSLTMKRKQNPVYPGTNVGDEV